MPAPRSDNDHSGADGETRLGQQPNRPRGDLLLTRSPHCGDALLQTADRLSRLAEDIAQISTTRHQFLSTVIQMLREPLTIAKGWMHTLRHSELSPEQERVAVVVDQQINELTCLLTDLLDSVRREATILELRLEVVDVAALVEQAAACQREQTDLQHVELEVHQDAAEAYAYVDCERITQALHMLINSACQRAPQCGDGKIDLTVALDKTAVHVTIRDNGIGIAAQHLPHIFEPFYQLEDHSRSNTSLELNTAYELVRSHGGALSVESAPGCGTAFHIWLHRVKRPPRNPA